MIFFLVAPLSAIPISTMQKFSEVSQLSILHTSTSAHGFQKSSQQQPVTPSLESTLDSNTSRSLVTANPSLATITASMQQSLSPSLQHYATYLKQLYSKKTTPVFDKELGLLRVKAKSFINIALVHKESTEDGDKDEMLMDRLHGYVDEIQRKKTKLCFSDVCKCEDGSLAHSVLVEGAPGVGKTTFASELCKQWADGKFLQEWSVVVMVKLRDERTRAAKNLYDILYYPENEIRQKVAKELVCQNGEGLLLILDGYDELSDNQRHFDSVIQQLMSRELLCLATLMVTSRPLATRTLDSNFQQSIDQHIEVLGFTKKNIEEFINSAFEDKPELFSDFKSYLSTNPFSYSLMYNPLQCAIVTNIYSSHWHCRKKESAPNTLTELYTSLVYIILQRYLSDHEKYKNLIIKKDLSDLPDDVKQNLKAVTSLAVKGITIRKYVFDEESDIIPSDTLGLMQREEEVTIGTSTSYYFLHLTLQEYLAAMHFLDQPGLSNSLISLKSFLKHYGEERKSFSAVHWPVALFIAGKTQLSEVPINLLEAGLHHDSHKNITFVKVSLLHLLYETQCPELIQSTLVTNEQYLSVSGNSALDWFVIGYCIAASASEWQVRKQSKKKIAHEHIRQLAMGLNLGSESSYRKGMISSYRKGMITSYRKGMITSYRKGMITSYRKGMITSYRKGMITSYRKGMITSLHITDKSWIKILNILEWLHLHTTSVTELKLVSIGKSKRNGQKCINSELQAHVLYPALETLAIGYANLSFSPFVLNIIGLQLQNNLQNLLLTNCDFDSEATSSILSSLQSPHCRLGKLTIDNCTIVVSGDTCPTTTADGNIASLNVIDKSWLNIFKFLNWIPKNVVKLKLIGQKKKLIVIKQKKCSRASKPKIVPLLYPALECLEVEHADGIFPPSIFVIGSQLQNSLHTLSLKDCDLNSEATSLLLHNILQSTNCRIQNLTLSECTVTIPDGSHKNFTSHKLECELTSAVSLDITSSSAAISQILLRPLFCADTLIEMTIELDPPSSVILNIVTSHYPMLESLLINKIPKNKRTSDECYLSSSVFSFSSQQNSLDELFLYRCKFDSEATSSFIHSLKSSHCRLSELTLDFCQFSTLDSILYSLPSFELKQNETYSLNVSCSCQSVSHLVSQYHFYVPFIFIIGSQLQNGLHTLSLKDCDLNSEATSSLLHNITSYSQPTAEFKTLHYLSALLLFLMAPTGTLLHTN